MHSPELELEEASKALSPSWQRSEKPGTRNIPGPSRARLADGPRWQSAADELETVLGASRGSPWSSTRRYSPNSIAQTSEVLPIEEFGNV